jgi:hypothetical protein
MGPNARTPHKQANTAHGRRLLAKTMTKMWLKSMNGDGGNEMTGDGDDANSGEGRKQVSIRWWYSSEVSIWWWWYSALYNRTSAE